ncbi:methionine--tRNA ligase [Borrelia miyamotoi]|uniref:Methionine--tRNA ligase n=1 Tax=Borrelia miyamotoi TaxID=47466 RepID=A0AAQ3AGF3_9SPIR|nr:methionine--tRNA ligase [Borrelia miyamotoi]AGT27536.1 methionyl-tRNA synthetase [Borrelia miyamotoi LB-2001]AJA58717.1 methionyl-tRNA synthetase [Borrelia miyamotoi]AOW95795.1 methionine--tRNA ligase [Borrelia miyamotoi]QTL83683.1 methionine--tRNA ligase [Borrelia miyamotoi]WAZ85014.1 methionine--tRNA ligase [Borrelia miyamotoi]
MKKKNLITAALPYVNNIPHLGNLVQVLSADAFARYSRMMGIETLYVCGTDEYGTATETKALIEKTTPEELCNKYHEIHKSIYEWFNIKFDIFGRTTNKYHKKTVQGLFLKLEENGYITDKESEQFFCQQDLIFLADRYVTGECPNCRHNAKGDQCENCSKLLASTDLINPKCIICKKTPMLKITKHLYIDTPKIKNELEHWIQTTSKNKNWNANAIKMTNAFLRDGLKQRSITRDLKWGIPVPKKGYENKVFYVWFDALIGYISITKEILKDWKSWWKNNEETNLVQFIGKDNILFHTVIFPSIELGSKENWTMLSNLASSEYLNYENLKFSKSEGTGIFGNDVITTGIPADAWRFYIYYNRPEKSDFQFTWDDFMERINSELIGNFSNLINRVLTFYKKFFGDKIEKIEIKEDFWQEINFKYKRILNFFKKIELKLALKEILDISSIGNKIFQDKEPWKTKDNAPKKTKELLLNLIYLIKDLSILISPFIPYTSDKIRKFFGESYEISNKFLGINLGLNTIQNTEVLFSKIEKQLIDSLKLKYSGSKNMQDKQIENPIKLFSEQVCLRVVKVKTIERNPEAEKLFILKLDDGTPDEKQIVSNLADYYKEEELLGKHIIIVDNLKPAKFRGIRSEGMLIATEDKDKNFKVIIVEDFKDNPTPGERIILESDINKELKHPSKINIDKFSKTQIMAENGELKINDINLILEKSKEKVLSREIPNGKIY